MATAVKAAGFVQLTYIANMFHSPWFNKSVYESVIIQMAFRHHRLSYLIAMLTLDSVILLF